MKEFLSFVGECTIIGLAMSLLFLGCQGIKEGVKWLKYHYKVKHRFNKPPTAKCYCRDCRFHGADGKCQSFVSKRTNDSWFCVWAEERKYYDEQEKP